jgi:hypothetical protein
MGALDSATANAVTAATTRNARALSLRLTGSCVALIRTDAFVRRLGGHMEAIRRGQQRAHGASSVNNAKNAATERRRAIVP